MSVCGFLSFYLFFSREETGSRVIVVVFIVFVVVVVVVVGVVVLLNVVNSMSIQDI